jgi:hypothetical protein
VALKATEQLVDTGTAAGKAFLNMLGVFVEFEGHLSCVRQVQQIGHGADGGLVQIKSSIPLFDRNPPSLRPDLPCGRAPRAAAVKDAAATVAAPAEPARSVLDRASPALD